MINTKYQLIAPKKIIAYPSTVDNSKCLVKPKYLSICAADQRYFFGLRDPKILALKLPLCLIHEGLGIVAQDNKEFKKNDVVVMYPNCSYNNNHFANENYDLKSKFMSSSTDGFLQEFVSISSNNLIKITDDDYLPYVLTEINSIAVHAIDSVRNYINEKTHVAIFGDGTLAFCVHMCLLSLYKNIKITIYGKYDKKLNFFSQSINKQNIMNAMYEPFDIGFECVGGQNAETIINDAINLINPCGIICLLGVSETQPKINTRLILEKGLMLVGRSRSQFNDFKESIKIISKYKNEYSKLISELIVINNISDIENSFYKSLSSDFKIVLDWEL